MSGEVRVGGRVSLPGGTEVVFSVAEGARGRRWRETASRDGRLVRALLLETRPDGRPSRLELSSTAGLLTLHPGVGETELHGNLVGPDGVRHLRFEWSPEDVLFIAESPAAAAAAASDLASRVGVGERRRIRSLAIGADLVPIEVSWTVERRGPDEWVLRSDDEPTDRLVRLDPDGIAVVLGLVRWPLELD